MFHFLVLFLSFFSIVIANDSPSSIHESLLFRDTNTGTLQPRTTRNAQTGGRPARGETLLGDQDQQAGPTHLSTDIIAGSASPKPPAGSNARVATPDEQTRGLSGGSVTSQACGGPGIRRTRRATKARKQSSPTEFEKKETNREEAKRKEKNRRAQMRYRERQKSKIQQTEALVSDLKERQDTVVAQAGTISQLQTYNTVMECVVRGVCQADGIDENHVIDFVHREAAMIQHPLPSYGPSFQQQSSPEHLGHLIDRVRQGYSQALANRPRQYQQ